MHVFCSSTLGHLHLLSNICIFYCFTPSIPSQRFAFVCLHQAHNEEISQERNERQRLERDLEEASRRLTMAHQDIRRLTSELDAAKNNSSDPSGRLQGFIICIHQSNICGTTQEYPG